MKQNSQCGCYRNKDGVTILCDRMQELSDNLNSLKGLAFIGQHQEKVKHAADFQAANDAYIHHLDLALCDHIWENLIVNPMIPEFRQKVTFCSKCHEVRDEEYHYPDFGFVADFMRNKNGSL